MKTVVDLFIALSVTFGFICNQAVLLLLALIVVSTLRTSDTPLDYEYHAYLRNTKKKENSMIINNKNEFVRIMCISQRDINL